MNKLLDILIAEKRITTWTEKVEISFEVLKATAALQCFQTDANEIITLQQWKIGQQKFKAAKAWPGSTFQNIV